MGQGHCTDPHSTQWKGNSRVVGTASGGADMWAQTFWFLYRSQKLLEFYMLAQVLNTNKIKQKVKPTVGSWVLLEVGERDRIGLASSPGGDLGFDSQDTYLPVQRPLSQATGAIAQHPGPCLPSKASSCIFAGLLASPPGHCEHALIYKHLSKNLSLQSDISV